jgi:isopentenyl diphosphate isomerase/L-lactate dehydrogenase-like FMN-dependent dehydrogenase
MQRTSHQPQHGNTTPQAQNKKSVRIVPPHPFGCWAHHVAMRNNSAIFDRVFFRPRVMRKVSEVDTSTNILGVDVPAPFYISPTARNGLGQPLVSQTSRLRVGADLFRARLQ